MKKQVVLGKDGVYLRDSVGFRGVFRGGNTFTDNSGQCLIRCWGRGDIIGVYV